MDLLVVQEIHPEGLARVRALLPDATIAFRPPGTVPSAADLRDRTILFADGCPAAGTDLTALQWIQLGSASYRQLSGIGLPEQVRVTNASGVNDIPIAEWCVLMMLSVTRDFVRTLRDQRNRRYVREAAYQAELRGRRVGIFGYGSIGRELTRLCRGVGLEVWALSRGSARREQYVVEPHDSGPDRRFTPGQLKEFLGGLDFLVITANLTDETYGFFGETELGWLPRHAVVLNPGRAHIISEQALLAALRAGTIAGAALDVHYREPMPTDDPFWDAPNTIVTPHVSGSVDSTHFLPRLWDLFATNVSRFLTGEPMINEIPRQEIG